MHKVHLETAKPACDTPQRAVEPPTSRMAAVVAPVAGLIGAWIAAGSVGLLGHPLRHALLILAIGAAVVAAWPLRGTPLPRLAFWIGGLIVAVIMSASSLAVINILAVAMALAAIVAVRLDARFPLRAATAAVAVFGVYRLALTSIPVFWMAADSTGAALGRFASGITNSEPLSIGATFAGLDFLVVMTAFLFTTALQLPRPRRRFVAWSIAGIVSAQLIYLFALAETPPLLDWLTPPPKPAAATPMPELGPMAKPEKTFPEWLDETAKYLLPWNLPLLAAALQAGVAAAMLARLRLVSQAKTICFRERWWLAATAAGLAALIPVATVLSPYQAALEKKKIVAYEFGLLNWLKPEHGEYGRLMVGMYGTFGRLVESFGGTFTRSKTLSDDDLRGVDLLVLFYPQISLDDAQLKRVQRYVENGGRLLLLCDHTDAEPHDGWFTTAGQLRKFEIELDESRFKLGPSRFNDLLAPTSIRVADDAAEFAVGGWLESYEPLAHPTTVGIGDHRNTFGVVIGASLEIQSPATPILAGRWGYSDHGDIGNWQSLLGNQRYDPGEKLGDLVLAAEQPWGKGRVIVFGDTSTFGNGIAISSYPFAARLLAYIAGDSPSSQAAWRQMVGALAVVALIGLLLWRATAWRVMAAAIALAASLAICVRVTAGARELVPDGRPAGSAVAHVKTPNRLAYIDMGHLGSFSDETIRTDGIFGFQHALMREDYLVLSLYDIDDERLSGAGLVASIGPQRPYTPAERQAIRRFVEKGGIFILMAGYERSAASRELMADFGFTVGAIPPWLPAGTEPAPLGHFKTPYYKKGDEYETFVRFHAGWQIDCTDKNAEVIAKAIPNAAFNPKAGGFEMDALPTVPVIMVRKVGQGKFVMIGDTEFALNKNLENEDGKPIEGLYENIDFWRWFIPKLRGTTPWLPPKPEPIPDATAPRATPAAGGESAAAASVPAANEPPTGLGPLPPSIDAGLPVQRPKAEEPLPEARRPPDQPKPEAKP